MRLKILRNIGVKDTEPGTDKPSGLPPYTEGEVCDCDGDVAETLLKRGLAEQTDEAVTPKKKVMTAAPAAAPVHAASPTSTKKDH